MSSYDFVRLTPSEVYQKYGRVPYSVVFHIMSVVLVTAFVVLQSNRTRVRRLAGDEMWSTLLWKDVVNRTGRHSEPLEGWKSNTYFLVERKNLLKDTHNMLNSYYSLERATVDDWFVYDPSDDKNIIKPPVYTVVSRTPDTPPSRDAELPFYDPGRSHLSSKVEKMLTRRIPGILGEYKTANKTIVEPKGFQEWLDNVVYVEFHFQIGTVVPRGAYIMSNPSRVWDVLVRYECMFEGSITASIDSSNMYYCNTNDCSFLTPAAILLFACAVSACFGQAFVLSEVCRSVNIYRKIRFVDPVGFRKLTWKDRLEFLKSSYVLYTAANVSVLFFCLLVVRGAYSGGVYCPDDFVKQMFLGIGVAALWMNVTQYIRGESRYNTIFVTLKHASMQVWKLLVGVTPVFVAYGLFGYAYYGLRAARFSDLSHTFMELFAVLNGDEIHPTYVDLEAADHLTMGFIEYVYLYSFIIIFSFLAARLCVSMIEDVYHQSKYAEGEFTVSERLSSILREMED